MNLLWLPNRAVVQAAAVRGLDGGLPEKESLRS
jgi:hypothetical protein